MMKVLPFRSARPASKPPSKPASGSVAPLSKVFSDETRDWHYSDGLDAHLDQWTNIDPILLPSSKLRARVWDRFLELAAGSNNNNPAATALHKRRQRRWKNLEAKLLDKMNAQRIKAGVSQKRSNRSQIPLVMGRTTMGIQSSRPRNKLGPQLSAWSRVCPKPCELVADRGMLQRRPRDRWARPDDKERMLQRTIFFIMITRNVPF